MLGNIAFDLSRPPAYASAPADWEDWTTQGSRNGIHVPWCPAISPLLSWNHYWGFL